MSCHVSNGRIVLTAFAKISVRHYSEDVVSKPDPEFVPDRVQSAFALPYENHAAKG